MTAVLQWITNLWEGHNHTEALSGIKKNKSLNTQIPTDVKHVLYYSVDPRLQDDEVHVVFLVGSHAIVKSNELTEFQYFRNAKKQANKKDKKLNKQTTKKQLDAGLSLTVMVLKWNSRQNATSAFL